MRLHEILYPPAPLSDISSVAGVGVKQVRWPCRGPDSESQGLGSLYRSVSCAEI